MRAGERGLSMSAIETPIDRLLPLAEVERTVGIGRSTIYRRMAEGTFPRPRQLSPHCVRWPASELAAWMAGLPESPTAKERA